MIVVCRMVLHVGAVAVAAKARCAEAGQLIFIANHWRLTSLSAATAMVPVDNGGELKWSWRV